MASINRVMNLLDTPIAIPTGDRFLPTVKGDVRFENITFAYRDPCGICAAARMPVLEHLTLHVAAGQTIGIVGSTGSGKSTLVKLLLRFCEVQQGQILLDGVDIRQL